jgi:nifR3 family TIM-barrel protein
MISAMGLLLGNKKSLDYLRSDPEEGPLAVQIFGSNPEAMAKASEIAIDLGARIIDINMGCPVRKVVKTGAGGALLKDLKKAQAVISAVRKACTVPLTVKIRAGWSKNKPIAPEASRIIEDCGADAITIHPRYVTQGFSGMSDWRIISAIKENLSIPVIGNGDVLNSQLAFKMRDQTGCDGVMIGRGAIGNLWIFKQILDLENGQPSYSPKLPERRNLIMEHYDLLSLYMGESRATKMMRGLLLWYTKGLPLSAHFRGTINRITNFDTLVTSLDEYFSALEERGL